ncbi:Piso0_001299 [Millerozyma farinosa CBS 7064]|uniref:Piso0_001299 protein n=1 Tax=Pichia sorbitophila (strain ATCC MYA-4447 / BCRC 22081 / CBS 7064 / NBRC 10061 / NRRL Y-12695) TaxID=559304 RepID=G8YMS9_PICSO|nr:Piso0_001299 [Millerozyma farinosa CBS 7064]
MTAIACNACALRKIRCNREQPCIYCKSKGMSCLYTRHQQKRGPKNLYPKTLRRIINQGPKSDKIISRERIEELLGLYEKYYYTIWPVVSANLIIENLESAEDNLSLDVACLISAVLLNQPSFVNSFYQSKLENPPKAVAYDLVLKTTKNLNDMSKRFLISENKVLCYYFLHVYYRSCQESNEMSKLYLREAITAAHILGLHDPATYDDMGKEEIHKKRKLYYLLFIAERYMALNCRLPLLLEASIPLPEISEEKDFHRIDGFLEIIKLVEIPSSDIYDLLSNRKSIVDQIELTRIIKEMHETFATKYSDCMSYLDIANISLYKCWIQAVLLKEAFIFFIRDPDNLNTYAIQMAQNFLNTITQIDPVFFEISDSGDYSFLNAILKFFKSVAGDTVELENSYELDVLRLIIKNCSNSSPNLWYTSIKSQITSNHVSEDIGL